jgi:hypothetical protein
MSPETREWLMEKLRDIPKGADRHGTFRGDEAVAIVYLAIPPFWPKGFSVDPTKR